MSESFWKEGLIMDSIFSDDDDAFLDWKWPALSPRRCNRECARRILGGMDHSSHRKHAAHSNSCSCSSSSSIGSNVEELFFYCTEELGSESTSGVGRRNLYAYDKDYASSSKPQASSSGRCAGDKYNWEFEQLACAFSTCVKSESCNSEAAEACPSSRNIPSHSHIANARHRHHRHDVSGGSNRAFPPPIASLLTDRPLMRSFKSNGRFVLKKIANVSRSMFRSSRKNGHLRLDLLSCPLDCLESQWGLLFPAIPSTPSDVDDVAAAESISKSNFWHDSDDDHNSNMGSNSFNDHWLRPPPPYNSILHHKPTLKYETLCTPSAVTMLMRRNSPHTPVVEESISTPATSFQAEHIIKGEAGGNAALAQSTPHVFALLKLLPVGLGLVIFEVGGKAKCGDQITLYGMYILKSFGSECSRASMSPSHPHLLTNSCAVSNTDAKGKPFSFEVCEGGEYMKGVFP